jgi:hypothetical protein
MFASRAQAQVTRDFSKVEVRTIKLTGNFYALDFGGVGSALGVLLVDAHITGTGTMIEAAIKKLSSLPIRYVINIYVYGRADHTGGNEYFSRLCATIIAREQVRAYSDLKEAH